MLAGTHNSRRPLALPCAIAALLVPITAQAAGQPDPGGLAKKAYALLEDRCSECHDDLARSGLNVLTRADLLKGGDHGAAIIPGNGRKSLVYRLVRHEDKPSMPPGKERLTDAETELLRQWIDAGAPYPAGADGKPREDNRWWSFRPLVRPTPPVATAGSTWAKTPIDQFIAARWQAAKLSPAPEADRATLLRRATFDLHGLPPRKEEVLAFVNDPSPDAWNKVIDRLLASPRYGERWGRHWLDLARYGDSGGFEQDPYLLDAWRFRDYVIESFNADKPFDRFIKEQIAGDEIWPDDVQARRGTGFYTVAPNRDMLFKVEDINRVETLTDYADTTGALFLGLSVGCARCHDHKFDPISQRDYYKLQAIFAPAVKHRIFLEYNTSRFWDISENYRQFKLRDLSAAMHRIFRPHREALEKHKKGRLPADARAAFEVPEDQRTPEQKGLVATFKPAIKVTNTEVRARLTAAERSQMAAFEQRLSDMYVDFSSPPMAPGIMDPGREAPVTYLPSRNGGGLGTPVRAGFIDALGGGTIAEPPPEAITTGRRRALAEWLVKADNPLTARVLANRLWHYHMGRGIVSTPNDFGRRGAAPTHPELLDWLAVELRDGGWTWKRMHRLIMRSAVYRQSTTVAPEAAKSDPENLLLSHARRRRLSAEEIRDAVLASTGTLNFEMGGPPVVPPLPRDELFGLSVELDNAWIVSNNPKQHTRRSVYLIRKRGFQQPLFEVFDAPDGVLTCPKREASTMAPQSLSLLNSAFMVEQAGQFADQIKQALAGGQQGANGPDAVPRDSVSLAWDRVFLRPPTEEERAAAGQFLAQQQRSLGSHTRALAELGRGLFNSNQFLYLE